MRRRKQASQSDEEQEKVESPLESDEASEGEAEARSDDEAITGEEGEEGEELEEGQQQQEGERVNENQKPGISTETTAQMPEVKKKEDPAQVPTSGRFFMHDDRGGSVGGKRSHLEKNRWDSEEKKKGNRRSKGNRRKEPGPKENGGGTLPQENKPLPATKSNPPAEKRKDEKIVRYSNLRTQQNPVENNTSDTSRRQRRNPKDQQQQLRYQPKQPTKAYVPRVQPATKSTETEPKPVAANPAPNGSNINKEQPPQNLPPPTVQPPALPFTVNAPPFTPMGLAFPIPQYPYQPYVLPPANFQYQYPPPYPPFIGLPPGMPMVNQPPEMQYYPIHSYAPVEGPAVSPRREEEQQQKSGAVTGAPVRQKSFKRADNQTTKTQWVPVSKPRSHAIPIVSPEVEDGNRTQG